MVGKGKAIGHGSAGIDYALGKDQAEVIDKNYIVGNNGNEIKKEFQIYQDLNQRCKNNEYSFVLSPQVKDGKALTNDQWKELSQEFLKRMNLDKHQSITIKHTPIDTTTGKEKHQHLHIFVNRIDHNGVAHKDNFIGKKAQNIADQLAQERGMERAKEIQKSNILNKELDKDTKKEIFKIHSNIIQNHKPKDFQQYCDLMKSNKVNVQPTINKAGKLQGFRLEYQGLNFKASEVHRSMTLSRMNLATSTPQLHKPLKPIALTGKALDISLSVAKTITEKVISYGLAR